MTVVFADMTESVRRTSGLTAEEATVLVNPLLETMVELMVRYGGRIDRFLGDGVLAVFGVPHAHEDDPFRAVRAAMELRERAVDLGLAVTAGVNTGRVYFGPVGSDLHEELTVMGPTVNLAARFQGAAAAGEIVVGASTAAHLRASFDLAPVTLQIKGIADPVEAFKAERLLDHPDKVRGIEGLHAELVGRDDEVACLLSALATGDTVAVVGPAGVGKSRLVGEFRAHVEAAGDTWLEGRCLALTEATGYGPFLDLFARLLPDSDRSEHLLGSLADLVEEDRLSAERADEIAPFLAHLLGVKLGDDRDLRVAESSADLRTTLTIDAIAEYLRAIARGRRLVLFLEDVHWSDPLSRLTIKGLHDAADPALMLVVAHRPDVVASDLLGPAARFHELVLTELSHSDGQRLISMLLEASGIPEWLETLILQRGQGNPFYVEELIRSLIQRGAITRAGGGWTVTTHDIGLDLPESVEGVLMSRFDRLADPTRRAAKTAAVLDRSFSTGLFSQLAGPGLVGELATLAAAGIIAAEPDDPDRFSFVHALTRQAIYTNLLPSQRAELHEVAARAFENTTDVEQVAFHYANSRNHAKAVEFLLLAGERALASFTSDSALALLEAGLTRIDQLPESDRLRWRGRYQARLGELLERMARHPDARSALAAALDAMEPDPHEEARLWKLMGRTHRLEADFDAAHRCYDQAEAVIERLSADDLQGRRLWIEVQKERGMALYFGGRGNELPNLNEQMAPVVSRHGTAAQRADHLYGQVLASFIDTRFVVPAETVETARRALAFAESGADPARVAEGRFGLGFALLWADEVEEAESVLTRAVEETIRVGAVTEALRARVYRAIALRRLGQVDEADVAAHEALEAADAVGHEEYRGHALSVLCWVAWRRGENCDELGEQVFEAWGEGRSEGFEGRATEFAWMAVWPRAAAALSRGDHPAAVELLRLLLVPWERPMPPELRTLVEAATSTADPLRMAEAVESAEANGFL
ncbi:MAG TPA: AAA family ATPase [Acidimicrobiia bacterium]|nr:AAA family ATPase [Acidimicrobiia bacterium]